jgi:hypothetical protein
VVPNRAADALPDGFRPADLRSAYGLTTSGSAAMSVAIVDAYDDRNAESDLATYRATFSPPACTIANGRFRKFNESGQASPLPRTDTGWAGEISLDLTSSTTSTAATTAPASLHCAPLIPATTARPGSVHPGARRPSRCVPRPAPRSPPPPTPPRSASR